MALRVLLADESSTIKKVMQLALQDFGIEVKSVPIGLDVLQVARSFKPDVIFADVLLSKRSGYDVSQDVKNDPQLNKIPVVLMWSSFMELDEARARQSGAERRLEKPFDADHLRSLVKDLVPRLDVNQISDYLAFPDLPEIVETPAPPMDDQVEEVELEAEPVVAQPPPARANRPQAQMPPMPQSPLNPSTPSNQQASRPVAPHQQHRPAAQNPQASSPQQARGQTPGQATLVPKNPAPPPSSRRPTPPDDTPRPACPACPATSAPPTPSRSPRSPSSCHPS
jgi:CheY-like chemotaxis protein